MKNIKIYKFVDFPLEIQSIIKKMYNLNNRYFKYKEDFEDQVKKELFDTTLANYLIYINSHKECLTKQELFIIFTFFNLCDS